MNYDIATTIIENRADPFIYKHTDGKYYFTATSPLYDKIVLRSSDTIVGLSSAEEYVVWTKHSKGEMSHYIWAPEIHYIDDSWYIYFAAKGTDSLDHTIDPHKMYVIECKDKNPISGKWTELGSVKTKRDSFSLDATTFEHLGTRYLVWAQMDRPEDSNSNIYMAKMKSPYEITGEQVMLTKPELPWEVIGFKVNEGPAVLKYKDKIIITYSASATDFNYAMGVLVADVNANLLDPKSWIKSSKPIRKTNETISEYGPGHNCFTIAEDDKTNVMVYHARNYKEIKGDPLYDHNRHTKVVKFEFESIRY